jgi:hypothetical protein
MEIYPTILADYSVDKDSITNGGIVNFKINDVFACRDGGDISYNWYFPEGNILSAEKERSMQVQFNNSYNVPIIFYPSISISQDGCNSNAFSIPIYVFPNNYDFKKNTSGRRKKSKKIAD